MNILREYSLAPAELQEELASYGIMRQAAKDTAPKYSGAGPQYFGLREEADEYVMYFTNDLRKIGEQDDPMQLAIVAPDNETFDLLAPKDYSKNLSLKDDTSLRRYLTNLLDSL